MVVPQEEVPAPDVWPTEAEELAAVLGPFVGRHEGLWTVLVRWQRWRLIHARQQRSAHQLEEAPYQSVEVEVCETWLHTGVNCRDGCLLPSAWCSCVTIHLSAHLPGKQAADQMGSKAHHKAGPKMCMGMLVSAVPISRKCCCSPCATS